MKKGVNALEIIFSLFVLIIVVLVVIKMFSKNVNVEPVVREIDEIREQYDYQKAESECNTICSDYQINNCDISKAVKFCKEKVEIDLDDNNEPGEVSTAIQHGAVIDGVPYCEDGYYCFHVMKDCTCGSLKLDPDTCDSLMCEYYITNSGLTEEEARTLIKREVNTGTCEVYTKDFPEYDFLDRDTVMGSDKNWFDIMGMGDCQRGTSGQTTSFSVSISSCDVTVHSNGNTSFVCSVSKQGSSCRGNETVIINDDNTGSEGTSMVSEENSWGSVILSDNQLIGEAVGIAGNTIDPNLACSIIYICDDPEFNSPPSVCTFQTA